MGSRQTKLKLLKNNSSRKHHYLPRYYLNGFTNNSGTFYIYDKQKDEILLKPLTPGSAFFENNLNTVVSAKGGVSDFLEDIYTESENQFWSILDTIRKSNYNTIIEPLDKKHLFLFLSFLHWRLPCNIKYSEELSGNFFDPNNKNLNFVTLKNKDDGNVPKEVSDVIKNSNAFKKASKVLLPFAPFSDGRWSERIQKWRFLYARDGKTWYLVGDNPIITLGDKDKDPINCLERFVFPVSGNIILVNNNTPLNEGLPPEFVIQFNISIIERAQRFIACPNKNFLEVLVACYKDYAQSSKTSSLIPELFNMLEKQSNPDST